MEEVSTVSQDDRFDDSHAAFAVRRRAARLQRDTEEAIAKAKAALEENRERVEANAKGEPLPIPSVVAGPPPKRNEIGIDLTKRYERSKPIREEYAETPVGKDYIPATVDLNGVAFLYNGCAIIPDCFGVRLSASGKGLLVESKWFSKPDWFPIKGIHEDSDVFEGGTAGKLVVEAWLVKARQWKGTPS